MSFFLHDDLTDKIIKAYYKVYNTLGYGFLEKVYQNALLRELRNMGMECKSQFPFKVFYAKQQVGEYYADIVVDDLIIIEIKSSEMLVDENEYQLVNYLKATAVEIGLLLNFGKKPEVKRKIFNNDRKVHF